MPDCITLIWNAVYKKPSPGRRLAEVLGASPETVLRANRVIKEVKVAMRKSGRFWRAYKFFELMKGCSNYLVQPLERAGTESGFEE